MRRYGAVLEPPAPAAHCEARASSGRFYLVAVAASLAVAALSLAVLPTSVGYDPWSWLIWGRELAHGDLNTAGAASSFKPYPVIVNALLAWTRSAEPSVWLLLARAGSVMGVVLVFHLGRRLNSTQAGIIAACGLVTSLQYLSYLFPDGMSEPTGAALCLAAADAHLDRRRMRVLILLAVAGLIRIEMWAFVAGYGAWWLWEERSGPKVRILIGLGIILVLLPLPWILPDLITSGDALRSAAAATHQSQGGPLLSSVPGLASLDDATTILAVPLTIAFLVELVLGAVALFQRTRRRPTFQLAVAALALIVVEAAMAEARVATGAIRYSLQAVAIGSVVAGCMWVDATRWAIAWSARQERPAVGDRLGALRRYPKAAVLAVAGVLLIGGSIPQVAGIATGVRAGFHASRDLATLDSRLPAAVRLAGGRERVLACGPVDTSNLQVPTVAWQLGLRLGDVGIVAEGHGTIFQVSGVPPIPLNLQSSYHLVGRVGNVKDRSWRVLSTCAS